MITPEEYNSFIRSESARFATCIQAADEAKRVPACPEWNGAALLWHLTEVQRFWTAIVSKRLDSPDTLFAERRSGPDPDEDALELFANSTEELLAALESAPDDTKVWTWASDKTVGFIRRRQAHEALIHRHDAESLVTNFGLMSPILSSDGIDEVLNLIYHGSDSTDFVPDGATFRITTTDTDSRWGLALGRRSSSEGLLVSPVDWTSPAELVVSGISADLNLWLWGRTDGVALDFAGDEALIDRVRSLVTTTDRG